MKICFLEIKLGTIRRRLPTTFAHLPDLRRQFSSNEMKNHFNICILYFDK